MVKFIIARQLVGKKVVTSDGYDVGRLFDFSPIVEFLRIRQKWGILPLILTF